MSAAILRLARAEWHGRRLVALALLLTVVAVATTGLVAGLETQSQAADRWDETFEQANGAHVTAYAASAEELRDVADDPRVAQASRPYRAVSDVDVVTDGGRDTALVRDMPARYLSTVGRPLLRDGRWANAGAADEIVVDRSYALSRGLHVGDSIRLVHAGRDATFTIVGIAIDLVDCFFPQCDPATTWVDSAGYGRLVTAGTPDVYSSVFLRLSDPHAVDTFVTDAIEHYHVDTNDWLDTRDDALVVGEFFSSFLASLGIFVMIAAATVVASSMASRVVRRRRDIGLCKAIGFTPRQLTASILLTNAVIAALGVVAGWLTAGVLAGPLQLRVADVLGAGGVSLSFRALVIAFVVVEAIVVVTTILPAWRAGRMATTTALSAGPPRGLRRSRLAHLGVRLGAGPVAVSGLKQVFARPARVFFTVAAMTLAVISVVLAAGFDRTIDHVLAAPALTGDPYGVAVDPQDVDDADITAALDRTPGVASWFTATERRALVGDEAFLSRALGGDVEHAGYVVREGRMATAAGEAVAGYGLLDRLGIDVGDRITVKIDGHAMPLRIVGWYGESEDGGEVLQYSLASLRAVEPDARVDGYLATLSPGADASQVTETLRGALDGQARVIPNEGGELDEADAFRLAFLVVAMLVVVVALTNLVATMLLAARERTRDVGVLRAVGFGPRQVLGAAAVTAAVLALIAVAVGVPVGLVASRGLAEGIGAGSGIGPGFGVDPSGMTIGLIALTTLAAGTFLGMLVYRRAATGSTASLVRFE
jgi:putative ABC transport system permease protein